jgi:glutathione synthase
MKFLFICDPINNFKLEVDSTIALMVAAKDLGYDVHYALAKDIFAQNNIAIANVRPIEVLISTNELTHPLTTPWYNELSTNYNYALNQYNAIMVRNDPPVDTEYYFLTQILALAENNNTKVINNTFALRNFNEKLSILNFPFITPTCVTKDKNVILQFIEQHGVCIIKPLDQMGGRGVLMLAQNDVNINPILELSTNYYTKTVMVQKFIPEVIYGDRRVFIVGGKVISHCLYRIPKEHQIRGNLAAGGRGEVHPLTSEDYVIANEVAKWLNKHNILFAGLDIIGNKLTEINITSPTGIRQILSQTGIDIAKLIIESISSTPDNLLL